MKFQFTTWGNLQVPIPSRGQGQSRLSFHNPARNRARSPDNFRLEPVARELEYFGLPIDAWCPFPGVELSES